MAPLVKIIRSELWDPAAAERSAAVAEWLWPSAAGGTGVGQQRPASGCATVDLGGLADFTQHVRPAFACLRLWNEGHKPEACGKLRFLNEATWATVGPVRDSIGVSAKEVSDFILSHSERQLRPNQALEPFLRQRNTRPFRWLDPYDTDRSPLHYAELFPENILIYLTYYDVQIQFRPYRRADAVKVTRLLIELPKLYPGGSQWLSRRLDEVSEGSARCTIATSGERIVGLTIETPKGKGQYKLSTIFVEAAYRRLGIGRRLLATCQNQWLREGVTHVHVTVDSREVGTIEALARSGFGMETILPERYGPGRDEAIMIWNP